MRRDDRAMLREVSRAVPDTAARVDTDVEPPSTPEVVAGLTAAWGRYRSAEVAVAGALVAITVRRAAAAMVTSGRSWIYLRDARLDQASATTERSYLMIEPRYGDRDLALLATYGWHVTFAAMVAGWLFRLCRRVVEVVTPIQVIDEAGVGRLPAE
jgi:hypothetical protein